MHYFAIAILPHVPGGVPIKQALADLLDPYDEGSHLTEDAVCECRYVSEESAYTGEPSPDCEDCHGSGLFDWKRNPRGKWDFWRIGARWDGVLLGLDPLPIIGDELHWHYSEAVERLDRNMCKASELANRLRIETDPLTPHTLIAPEGVWVDRDDEGLEPPDMKLRVLAALDACPAADVIALDYHV